LANAGGRPPGVPHAGATEQADLGLGQTPDAADRQVAEAQRTETHPLQRHDGVADLFAHPPDLTLSALVDRQLQGARRQAPDPRGRGSAVIELHAGP